MKRGLYLLLGVLLCVFLSPAYGAVVKLANETGALVPVTVDDNRPLFVAATWCPYCHKFIALLKDPEIKPYLKGKQLGFVYKDEWPEVEQDVKIKLPELMVFKKLPASQFNETYAAVMAQLRKEKGPILIEDRAALKGVPGTVYFLTAKSQAANKLAITAYPKRYNPATHAFDQDVFEWVRDHTGVPAQLLEKKKAQYFGH